jgi:predicted ABC-type exoprotein transport system permease subunit
MKWNRAHTCFFRLRYWWLDTRRGEQARIALFALAFIVALIALIRMPLAASASPLAPAQAIFPLVVQLIIALVMAVISYATRPKPQKPTPQAAAAPTTEDGLAAKHYFGTCWVTDEFLLAWKLVGTESIKSKGGKK